MPALCRHILLAALLLLASAIWSGCAAMPGRGSARAAAPGLPAPVPFNAGAGEGDLLYVPLRLGDGPDLQFLLDTGSHITVLDSSLVPKLGPRLGKIHASYAWFGNATMDFYAAPPLQLGDATLRSGERVYVDDLASRFPGRRIMGILGMDCLRRYCLQFDFDRRELRFLPAARASTLPLGQSYPLALSEGRAYAHVSFLSPQPRDYLIDTGCTIDGVMRPEAFMAALRTQPPSFRKALRSPAGVAVYSTGFEQGNFGRAIYVHLLIDGAADNFLGLRFLARHIVTLDFPNHVMYLRRLAEPAGA